MGEGLIVYQACSMMLEFTTSLWFGAAELSSAHKCAFLLSSCGYVRHTQDDNVSSLLINFGFASCAIGKSGNFFCFPSVAYQEMWSWYCSTHAQRFNCSLNQPNQEMRFSTQRMLHFHCLFKCWYYGRQEGK